MICMICRKEEVQRPPRRVMRRRGIEESCEITCAKKIVYYFVLFLLTFIVYISFRAMYLMCLSVKRALWKPLASS